ncbi:hypothetical protein CFC21_045038 [Triticum aestivum]|uniref:DUF4220 domain-containing protein n=4 Tax=Triticum TaxID=4564 RepID=A0A9R1SA17_TRITD|nr:hypothetical protein CFC21_045038 [Triticum aestivum]VAH86695.1 unnamed protein product [Triticum turgidum subsp. durum]
MAGELEILLVAWEGWGIQVMVLLSFTVQVTLLLLADIRRRNDSTMLKFIIWSAYMLADTTALYALGHMSLVSRSPEQQLMVLWAPLLLVHLGGQDNITAYAIEDNRLWLRHLHTFGLQVLAAGYVLYASSVLGSRTWVRPAAILMFVVGVLKYEERVWALMCASNSASSSLSATSYKDFRTGQHQQLVPEGDGVQYQQLAPQGHDEQHRQLASDGAHQGNQKDLLFLAFTLLDVPKQLFEGPARFVKINRDHSFEGREMLEVVGMQLSMMYDLLYTKAAVVHTWYGRCIRVITLPATVTALLLFHRSSDKHGYHRIDVVVTYVLLGGAVILETTSVLRTMFSKWTYAFMLEKKCALLAPVVRHTRRIHKSDLRGYMGQHELFRLCAHSRNNTSSKIARWMGREDQWDSMAYSYSIPVPLLIIQKVLKLVSTREPSQFDITNSRGRNALRRYSALSSNGMEHGVGDDVLLDLEWTVELDLDESILMWHIATRLFLGWLDAKIMVVWREEDRGPDLTNLFLATGAMSNYMFFLLAARPYMLPYPVSRQRYVQLCYDMINCLEYTGNCDLLRVIWDHGTAQLEGSLVTIYPPGVSVNLILDRGSRLGARLIRKHEDSNTLSMFERSKMLSVTLEVIFEVWVEMLCHTAYWCNENSHAKHLSSGVEIMTTISLLMIYMSSGFINKNERSHAPDIHAAPRGARSGNV